MKALPEEDRLGGFCWDALPVEAVQLQWQLLELNPSDPANAPSSNSSKGGGSGGAARRRGQRQPGGDQPGEKAAKAASSECALA